MNNLIFKENEVSGKFSLMISRPAPKARFGMKILANYYFRTAEARENYRNEFINKYEAAEAEKAARKAKQSEIQKNMVNPFKVGDILYASWGYEQTNIDFFQIVGVGKKSVTIQKIGQEITRHCAFMSEYVRPVKDSFVGEPASVNLRVEKYGNHQVYIPHRHGLDLWDLQEVYQSHYA